jgi:hypothetical protein
MADIYLKQNGNTYYKFNNDNNENDNILKLKKFKESKGIGIISSKQLNIGDTPINNISLATIPIGKERRRICFGCFCVVSKVKVRDDCKLISFCSLSCMEKSRWFLDTCGVLCQLILDSNQINNNNNNNSVTTLVNNENSNINNNSFADSHLLCVLLLYNLHRLSEDKRNLEIDR